MVNSSSVLAFILHHSSWVLVRLTALLPSSDIQGCLGDHVVAVSLSMALDIKHVFWFFPLWGGACFYGNGNGLDIISCSVVIFFLCGFFFFPSWTEQEKVRFPFSAFCKKTSKGFEKEAQAFTLQSRLFGMRRIHKWVTVLSLVTEAGSEANVP